LPNEFQLGQYNKVYDENGVEFDNLRGANSLVADLEKYINSNGGAYDMVVTWADEQGAGSWNDAPQGLRWWIVNNRTEPLTDYFWQDGTTWAEQQLQAMSGGKLSEWDRTFTIFHAWNYEMLQKIDMPNNDRQAGTFRVVRTEDKDVIQGIYNLKPGDTGVTMPRGAAESGSMFSRINVFGNQITVQNVPHHRVFGMYLQGRHPLQNRMFLGDDENEIICLFDKIPFDYLSKRQWKDTKTNYVSKATTAPFTISKLDFQQFAFLKGVPDIPAYFQQDSISDIKTAALLFGLDSNDIQKYGSSNKKETYYKAFEDLKSLIP